MAQQAKLIAAQNAGQMAACRLSNRSRRRVRPTVSASVLVFVLLVFGTCCSLVRLMLRNEQVPGDVSCGAASHASHRTPAAGHDSQPNKVREVSSCGACSICPLRCPQCFSQKIGATSVTWHSPATQCKVSYHRCDAQQECVDNMAFNCQSDPFVTKIWCESLQPPHLSPVRRCATMHLGMCSGSRMAELCCCKVELCTGRH